MLSRQEGRPTCVSDDAPSHVFSSRFVSPVATFLLLMFLVSAVHSAQAQTESVLYNFTDGLDGGNPRTNLVADKKGNLYGTTAGGQTSGAVFKVTPSGTLTVLYNFSGAGDGAQPLAGLVIDKEGNLYGTTLEGGTFGDGTIFMVTPSGTETVLHSFGCYPDGCFPNTALVFDKKGNLYGGTVLGGAGTVFKFDPSSGILTTLYTFTGGVDGGQPAGVVLDKKDNIYGTTVFGGASGFGVVFKVTPSGTETVLHSFTPNGQDGFDPAAGLTIDSKGNLYGTTSQGGAIGVGTVFEVSASGAETVLYSFAGGTDGINPEGGLVFDTAGNLYGTTFSGGSVDLGTVFKLTPSGTETVLHSFADDGKDGFNPEASLVIRAGNLYGTTPEGGNNSNCGVNGCGTVFEIIPNKCDSSDLACVKTLSSRVD